MTTTIAEYSPTEQALSEFRKLYSGVVFDLTKPKGLADAKAARADLRSARIALENKRKEIKEPALTRCREIDTEAKRITAELEALEGPIDQQIKGEEQRKARELAEAQAAEAARQQAIRERFDAIKALRVTEPGATVENIDALIATCTADDYTTLPPDMHSAFIYERSMTLSTLKAARQARIDQDAKDAQAERDRQELEQLRLQAAIAAQERERRELQELQRQEAERQRIAAEAEAQARQEREEQARREGEARAQAEAAEAIERANREAAEAAERERLANERAAQQRIEDAERAEREKAAAVQRAKDQAQREADQRERDRLAKEESDRMEAERKAANNAHRGRVNRAAVAAIVGNGIAEETAKQIVTLIAQGAIPAITINY